MSSGHTRNWAPAAYQQVAGYFVDSTLPGFMAVGTYKLDCLPGRPNCQLSVQFLHDNFPRVPWQYDVPRALGIEHGFDGHVGFEEDVDGGTTYLLLSLGDVVLPFFAVWGAASGPPGSGGLQSGDTIWRLEYDPSGQTRESGPQGLGPNRYYLFFRPVRVMSTNQGGVTVTGRMLFVVEMGWQLPAEDTLAHGFDRFVTQFEFIKPKPVSSDFLWESWGVTPFGWTSMSDHIVPSVTHPIVAPDKYVWHNNPDSEQKIPPAVTDPAVMVVAPCDCILFSIEGIKRCGSGGVYYDYTVRLALTPWYSLVVFHLSQLHTYEVAESMVISSGAIGSGHWGWPDQPTEDMGYGKAGYPAIIPADVAAELHGLLDEPDEVILDTWQTVGPLVEVPRGTIIGWAGGELGSGHDCGGSFDQGGFDISGTNYKKTARFVNPARYPAEFLHADSPLQYFTADALTQYVGVDQVDLEELMRNLAGPAQGGYLRGWWGRFCWENGKASSGYLIGNWFEQGTTPENFMEDGGRRQLSIAPDWEFPEQIDVTIGNDALWLAADYYEDGKWTNWPGYRTGLFRVIDLLANPKPDDVWWEDYSKELGVALVYKFQEQRNPLATDDNWYRIGFLVVAFTGPDTVSVQTVAKARPSIAEVMPPAGFLTPGIGPQYWASVEHEFQR
jgi:hypothetical protein